MKTLSIRGEVAKPYTLTRAAMAEFDAADRIDDMQELGAKKPGAAVRLKALVERAAPVESVRYITFYAPHDQFYATAPLDRIIDQGYLIYALDGADLPEGQGGPFRFLIPNPAACKTDEIDECLNVKYVEEILLTSTKGKDTRPRDEDEHAELHARENAS